MLQIIKKLFHYTNPFLIVHANSPTQIIFWTGAVLIGGVMVMLTIKAFIDGTDSKG
jgi:branched-subunit amino acid transport protein AzlD